MSEGSHRVRDPQPYSGFQRVRPCAPALRGIGRRPATHSIRLTVAEHTRPDNPALALDAAAISLLAAIGAEFVADVYLSEDEDE